MLSMARPDKEERVAEREAGGDPLESRWDEAEILRFVRP
jgi:hypothetical protein